MLLQQVKSQQVAVTFVHLRHCNTYHHIQEEKHWTSGWPPTQLPSSPRSEQQERGRTTCSSTVGFRAGFFRHTWSSCRHQTRLLFSTQKWISLAPHLPGFLHLLCHESTAVQLALGHVPSPAEMFDSRDRVRFKLKPQIVILPCHWCLWLVGQIVSHLGHHLRFHGPRNL